MAAPWYRWPKGLRASILHRDGGTCQIRGPRCTTKATCIDHITPANHTNRALWFWAGNLRAACKPCNEWAKHNRAHASQSRAW